MEWLLTAVMNGWLYLDYHDYQIPGLEWLPSEIFNIFFFAEW